MPDGRPIAIKQTKLIWKAFDFLVFAGLFSTEDLMRLAHFDCDGIDSRLAVSLRAVVWRANTHARHMFGFDCFAVYAAPSA